MRLEDELPEGVEFVSAEECSDFFRVVNCTLGSLTPGQSTDVSFTVQVSPTETSITNTFIVVGQGDEVDPVPLNNILSLTNTVIQNQPPSCSNIDISFAEDSGVTNRDLGDQCTDADGDPIDIEIVSQSLVSVDPVNVTDGLPFILLAGSIDLEPAPNFNGSGGAFAYRAVDSFGATSGDATGSVTVTAVNDPPVVSATSTSVTVDEGQTANNSGNFSDVDGDTVAITASVGAVTKSGSSSGTWSWSWATTDGPDDSGTVTIVADDGTVTTSASFSLTVDNAAPVVTLSGAVLVDEGDTESYTIFTSDPGDDTFILVGHSCGTGGSSTIPAFDSVTGSGSFECTFPNGPANSIATVQVGDSDDIGFDILETSIANVTPVVTLSGPVLVNEGDTETYSFTASDPGDDTFILVGHSCGTGGSSTTPNFDNLTGSGSFDCTFPDGPANSTATVQVGDSDDVGFDVIEINIANVAPNVDADNGTVTVTVTVTVNEGQPAGNTGTFSDPGGDTVTITASSGSVTQDDVTGTWSWSFDTSDGPDETRTVTITATDTGLAATGVTFELVVNNVAPDVTLTGPANTNEGNTESYSFTASDPGNDTFSLVTQDCGANGTLSNPSFSSTTGAGSFDCDFPDGPADSNVRVQVADSDGANSNFGAIAVDIANVAPEVDAGPPVENFSGEVHNVLAGFTDDVVLDTHTATIDWGEGADSEIASVTQGDGFGTVSGSHRYFIPGIYTIEVTVTDIDGGVGSGSTEKTVLRLVVTIDIKPGSDPNSINPGGKGLIPVGVFSGTYRGLVFDAAEITGSSLAFEGAGITHKAPHLEDLDGAGARDSVSHYRIPETSLTSASVEGCLTGETSSGIFFTGCGLVNIVPPEDSETGGKGKEK